MNPISSTVLENLNSTKDLKRLSPNAMRALAAEIRRFLVHSLSDTGGHLASNLGVVELTLALHTVFNSPVDKIIWDVGHQSYVHKILTGRKDMFHALRKLDGLSGFPKIHESEHDAFGTGHSSTAISAALGLAMARDLKGAAFQPVKEKIVAIVGDGSMTGGLAYEGLNNAGRANTDLLVVLNDNQMSIGRNVGAISRHLSEIRTASGYLGAKEDVHQILDQLPIIGSPLSKGIESLKGVLKRAVLPGVLFEEMGFRYFGPVNGHDIPALINVLRNVKNIPGPVLLHVLTKKGKGYKRAEKAPTDYHGVGTFCVNTGAPVDSSGALSYTDIFSSHLCRLATTNKDIVAISAAMDDGTGLTRFKSRFPKRFFDVGIAESHAVTFAAGLAQGGLRPVVAIYSSFMQRAYDQIIHDVATQNLPVIFALDRAGIVGEDGETHQGLYDIAFLSHMPNMTILAPSSGEELKAMLDFAVTHNGPVAIRYPKGSASRSPCTTAVVYAGSETIVEGKDIAIVTVGAMRDTGAQVVEILKESGHKPGLYNARFIKPLDMDLVARLSKYSYVFTLEDATRLGGYGTRLQPAISEMPRRVGQRITKFHGFAFPDAFIEAGKREELIKRYGLDAESLANKIIELTKNTKERKK